MSIDVIAKPKNGARVRMENGQLLPSNGTRVPRNSYWLRRQKDDDVELQPLASAAAPEPEKPSAASEQKPKAKE